MNVERRTNRLLMLSLGLVAYVPLLLTHRGQIGADTKAYLYLDPGRLLSRAPSLWDPNTGMGTVTHQNIGYLLPMGPWYWSLHALGMPMWVAERLWLGTLLTLAGVGVWLLLRTIGWRGPAIAIAALAYELTPYVAQYEARISAILMPWAGLPWMLAFTVRALRRPGWRDPAAFALVVALVGGVNATSLIFAGIAPVAWIVFAAGVVKEVSWGKAFATAGQIGVLTVATSLWWIAGLSVQSGYGLDVLRYTETVEVVARTGVASEVLRGLGNWFFYGRDAIAAWVQPAVDYTQWGWLLAVSFAVPVLAFSAAAVTRWTYKLYFVGLIVVGVALAVGIHPYAHPSPVGALMKAFATRSTAGLALRSTGRAVPLVALGTAVLVGAGLHAVWLRRPALGAVAAVGTASLILAGSMPLFAGQYVDTNLQRPERLPAYWSAVAGYLDSRSRTASGYDTRVLEIPGADFSHYTWGSTLDPITPGITARPFVGRELVPTGTAASADLLRALDRRLQEGVFEPAALAPIARMMGVGDVVLRSDLQWQRFSTARPRPTWSQFASTPPGIDPPVTFGPVVADGPSAPPIDERTLGLPVGAPSPPAVAVFGVTDPVPLVRSQPATAPLVLAGDGEGMVDAAAAGLLDGVQPVLYDASLPGAAPPHAELVLTDTNRRRAQRWGTIRETYGYTEQAGETPLVGDPSDARLPVFPGAGDSAFTVAEERGVASVRASHYGNGVSYAPASRPDLALDGNPATAWTVGAFGDPVGERLRVDLVQPVTTGVITLQQPGPPTVPAPPGTTGSPAPLPSPGRRWITRVRLRFDRGPDVVADLDAPSTKGAQAITFPARTFGSVEVVIDALNIPRGARSADNAVGFSEVGVGGATVDEVLRLPTDLLSRTGAASAADRLLVLLTRDRADPAQPIVADREAEMARTFDLPTARTFTLGGTGRVSALAPDPVIDPLLGTPRGPVVTNSSGRLPGDLTARSSLAFDGDPTTAWSPARGPQEGAWIRVDVPVAVPLDHLSAQLVADGRHSVPTRLRVQVDDQAPQTVTVPALADNAVPGSVRTVALGMPGQVAHHSVLVTIDAVRPVTTPDLLSGKPVVLPVGIAELALPGVRVPSVASGAATSLPADCRTDLLTVDGRPIGVRVVGSTAQAAARQALTIEPCSAGGLALSAGSHLIRTAPGQRTGIDVDRLLLASAAGGGPDPALTEPSRRAPSTGGPVAVQSAPVQVLSSSKTSMRVRMTGSGPAWLVLGQSLSPGWRATIDGPGGGSLGAPRLIDGYANGWMVDVPPGRTVTISIRWSPQSRIWLGLLVSALAVVACLALLVLHRRSPIADPGRVGPMLAAQPRRATGRVAVSGALAGAGAAAFVTPWTGAVVAGAVVLAWATRRPRAALGAGAAGALLWAAAAEVLAQWGHHFPLVLEWPQHFETSGRLAWVAVWLLVAHALVDHDRHEADRGDG